MTPLCHKKHTSTLIYSGKNSNEGQRSQQRGNFTKIRRKKLDFFMPKYEGECWGEFTDLEGIILF